MKKTILTNLLVASLCLTLSSCASIIHGTRQEVGITTNPPGAIVSDGKNNNNVLTPTTLKLERDRDYVLTITKPGFETETVKLTHVISGAVAANIVGGGFGLIGWGVDAVSGAQWRLEPETIVVNLRPLKAQNASQVNLITDTLEGKLEELEALKEKKLISEEEYKAMRELCLKTATSL